jgi:hypothetical protein
MKKSNLFLVLCSSLLVLSCQKVINIDLNSASPAIVIVGNINDQPGPYTVTLCQTVNFSEPNTFPPVSGAFITIADNAGNTDTLIQTQPGIYNTKKIMGVAGRTYTLTVIANEQTYTASCIMPQAITFDTLEVVAMVSPFRRNSDTSLFVQAGFYDPTGIEHYYRFIETRNDTLLSNIRVINDEYDAGHYLTINLRSDTSLIAGDSVKVEMQCIDKGTYQYLSTFSEANGSSFVTPANPISNISNNALGYFSAHTSRFRRLKVPF